MQVAMCQTGVQPKIRLISTDFDGTVHVDFEDPPMPVLLQAMIGYLQKQGASWVVNTGRALPSLLGGLASARLEIRPDFLVVVEREIHYWEEGAYQPLTEWNELCQREQDRLFDRIRSSLPAALSWIRARFTAYIYADAYSPFCLEAQSNEDADAILAYLAEFFRAEPELTIVRNDIYARFSHAAYNKGTAMAEIARRLDLAPDQVFAAGDHLNDLPMLSLAYARWLAAPANAVEEVKTAVLRQQGYVSQQPFGHGVAQGLAHFLEINQMLPALLK